MEPVSDDRKVSDIPYISDPLLDEEVDAALAARDERAIWNLTTLLSTMDEEEYQLHRSAIKKRIKLNLTALDKAVAAKRNKPEPVAETDDEIPPNKVAASILAHTDLLNVGDSIYRYDGCKWCAASPSYLTHLALHEDGDLITTKNRRVEIASFIKDKIYRREHKWRQIEMYEVPVANGVIDVRTMAVRPHSKEDYLQTCIPWSYSQKAQCPQLMRCLDTYFGKDDDCDAKIAALQEFFGYCLMPHARYKKALLCVGESDCGKSTIPFLLRTLLGSENIAAVGVEHMDDSRKRAPLLGKLVNLLTELTSDAMIADGGFKTLVSTEEPIEFDPKYAPPVMDIPICKHVIVTNTKPRINDKSNATYRRLLLVHFEHVIPKSEQDTFIWDRLREEIDGILSWALEGANRLYHASGIFTDPGAEDVKEYKKEQDVMKGFIDNYCEVEAFEKTRTSTFIDRFRQHNPGKWPSGVVLQMARDAGLVVEANPTAGGDGKKYRHVIGIKIQ